MTSSTTAGGNHLGSCLNLSTKSRTPIIACSPILSYNLFGRIGKHSSASLDCRGIASNCSCCQSESVSCLDPLLGYALTRLQ
jgi:hypothetical protein